MEEARRFLRYVVPGLIFIIEILATLLLMDNQSFMAILKEFKDVGSILGIFVVSGGLGYLFSNIYFWIYWSWPFKQCFGINHLNVIQSLKKNLEIVNVEGENISNLLDKRKGCVIINVFWHCRLKDSKRIEGINKKNDQVSDITHGLGATVVATLSAAIVCLFLYETDLVKFNDSNIWWLIFLWFMLIVPSIRQYLRAHSVFQALVNSTFANEVITESREKEKPLKIIYEK